QAAGHRGCTRLLCTRESRRRVRTRANLIRARYDTDQHALPTLRVAVMKRRNFRILMLWTTPPRARECQGVGAVSGSRDPNRANCAGPKVVEMATCAAPLPRAITMRPICG